MLDEDEKERKKMGKKKANSHKSTKTMSRVGQLFGIALYVTVCLLTSAETVDHVGQHHLLPGTNFPWFAPQCCQSTYNKGKIEMNRNMIHHHCDNASSIGGQVEATYIWATRNLKQEVEAAARVLVP